MNQADWDRRQALQRAGVQKTLEYSKHTASRLGWNLPKYYRVRNEAIHSAWKLQYYTLRRIGVLYGVSAERVRQIAFKIERIKKGEKR